ncbi:MAG: formylglycine-generating enzyme family protein [Deltaproteobacteria bacterium]|nr:formylglycine-generating enzyme family protein [Deltaproteobacteria bacterium]
MEPKVDWADNSGTDQYGTWADLHIGGVVQRFRWCPPGEFALGSPEAEVGRTDVEGPQQRVVIRRGFWMGDTPVTQRLWLAFMGTNPSSSLRGVDLDRPVEDVGWYQAVEFGNLLTQRSQRAGVDDDGLAFRLPSEAEWEYACRAGTASSSYSGDFSPFEPGTTHELDRIAWFAANTGVGDNLNRLRWMSNKAPNATAGTRAVKQKAPNAWGIFDSLGNVWEWCFDSVHLGAGYQQGLRVDPLGRVGGYRALRGGCWYSRPRELRAASRVALRPKRGENFVGFRLVRGKAHDTDPL